MKKLLCILLAVLLFSGCTVTPPAEEPSQETATTTTAETTTVTTTAVTTTTATTATPPTYKPTWTVTVSKTQRPTTTTAVPSVSKTPGPMRPTTSATDAIIPDGRLYIDGKQVSGVTEDGFHYIVYHPKFHGVQSDENWALITRYSGNNAETLTVPDEVAGYPVYKVIVDPTHRQFKQLVLPDTVQILEMPNLEEAAQLTDIWLPESCTFTFSCTPVIYEEGWLIPRCAPTVHISKSSTAERLSVTLDESNNVPFSDLFEHEVGREEVFDLSQYDPSGFVGVEEFVTDYKTGELVPYRMSGYISFE